MITVPRSELCMTELSVRDLSYTIFRLVQIALRLEHESADWMESLLSYSILKSGALQNQRGIHKRRVMWTRKAFNHIDAN
jgi:hypothetical protein